MSRQIIDGYSGKWEVVIGLEVHAQVKSQSKLFSASSTGFGAEPNNNVSFIDAAMPGMLPVLNRECVRQAIRTGLGLRAQINGYSVFDRKNYFYADLPQGYQISQFNNPIVGEGVVDVDLADGSIINVGIERLHLEQDAGKSIHDDAKNVSYIDLNRCGVALMEIVTKPDLRSSKDAGEFVKKLRSILRYLDTCDGDMEKGSLRCDANVSVRPLGSDKLGTRAEIKNLNSVRNIIKAIDYEAARQVELIESGGKVDQETRLFDADAGTTRTMRSKEDAHDYRYFPDPDLPPVEVSAAEIDELKNNLAELPDEKRGRYINDYGLSAYDASVIIAEKEVAAFFEEAAVSCDPKKAVNWISVELFSCLNKAGLGLADSKITPTHIAELVRLIDEDVISGKIAKQVFEIMFESGDMPSAVVEKQGLTQISDEGAIAKIIEDILKNNADKVEQYRSGKDKLFGFFVGQVMKEMQGKANPQAVNKLLKDLLDQ